MRKVLSAAPASATSASPRASARRDGAPADLRDRPRRLLFPGPSGDWIQPTRFRDMSGGRRGVPEAVGRPITFPKATTGTDMKSLIAVVFALTTVVGLVSCSDNGQDSSSEIAESEAFNQVDVDFATDMIQHHAQALAMVDMTVARELSPELTRHTEEELAEREAAQGGDF